MSRFALILMQVMVATLAAGVVTQPEVASQPGPPPGPLRARELAPPPHVPWPMYGGSPSRNMVNLHDRNLTLELDDESGLKLRWKAFLGNTCYSQPVVAGSRVFVGTNNAQPRNKRDTDKNNEPIDKSVMMCFDTATGAFLWQAVHDKLPSGLVNDFPDQGICSIPAVVGDRVYYVSNQCRVVCADVNGFADGNQGTLTEKYTDATDGDLIWEYDMIRELKVFPHNMATGCPLIIGDLLFVQTSNGVDENHINLPSPDAPSFICLNRLTGKLVWSDNSPGKDIMHGQWASPAYAAGPVPQVIFPGGDGWLRAFDPPTGRLLWKFDCNPKDAVYELGGTGTRNDFIAAPVVYEGRAYIGVGQDPEHSAGIAYFWCVDLSQAVKRGATRADRDVSPDLLTKVVTSPDGTRRVETRPNPASALAWSYGGVEERQWAQRDFRFGRTMSTACVVDGILYAPELGGYLHCMDARTGKHFWQYDTKSSVWGSAYYVDGKILIGNDQGDLFLFRHEAKPEIYDEVAAAENAPTMKLARVERNKVRAEVAKKYLIAKAELAAGIRGTPTVVGGVLYVATMHTLYAFGQR